MLNPIWTKSVGSEGRRKDCIISVGTLKCVRHAEDIGELELFHDPRNIFRTVIVEDQLRSRGSKSLRPWLDRTPPKAS